MFFFFLVSFLKHFSIVFRLLMFWANCKTKLLQLPFVEYLEMQMSIQWSGMRLQKLLVPLQVHHLILFLLCFCDSSYYDQDPAKMDRKFF